MPSAQDVNDMLRALDILRRRLLTRQQEIASKYIGALETRKAGEVRDQAKQAYD